MTYKKLIWWEKQKIKGKWGYIVEKAIIFTVTILIFDSVYNWLMDNKTYHYVISAISYLIIGIILGCIMWRRNEAEYQEHSTKADKKLVFNHEKTK